MIDSEAKLGDGRTLAFTDCGRPEGPVVFYFHGAPTSRLDLVPYDEAFSALGVRVVSPDRPGYGGSSPQRGRRREDWPADVVALADHLGVDRFAVMGMSSGGPYAVVCAAMLPDHVTAAAVVAGVTDMGWPGAWDGFLPLEADLMRVGDEDAAVAWCEEHFGTDGSRFFEGAMDLAPADLELLADEAMAGSFMGSVREAFRQGVQGYAQDVTVQSRPWPFDPATVSVPVLVLHGEADTLAPLAHARHTAKAVRGAALITFPDHGHLSILREMPALAAQLAGL